MPGNVRSKVIALSFPKKGTDQGSPLALQPKGTTPNCLNVRALDARNRTGGGKRGGIVKALTTASGSGLTSQRVVGLSMLADARAAPGSLTAASTVLTTIDFTALTVASPCNTSTTTNGVDLVGFKTDNATTPIAIGEYTNHNATGAGTGVSFTVTSIAASGAVGHRGLSPLYYSENDCTVSVRARDNITFAGANNTGGWGDNGECGGVGPFIRADVLLQTAIMARIRPISATTIKLEIVVVGENSGSTQQVLASSAVAISLNNSGASSDFSIRLRETTTGVEATLTWVGGGAAASTISETISATTTKFQGQSRCGVMVSQDTGNGAAWAGGTKTNYRIVQSMIYTKRVPESSVVYNTADVTQANTSNNNYVTFGFRSQGHINGSSTVTTVDATSAEQGFGTNQTNPTIDDANNWIEMLQSATNIVRGFLGEITAPSSGDRRGVEVQPRVGFKEGTPGQTQQTGAAFRVSDDGKSYVALKFRITGRGAGGGGDAADVGEQIIALQTSNMATVVADNLTITTTSVGTSTVTSFMIRDTSRIKITDDGTFLRLYVNGMLFYTVTPSGVPASIASNRRCGAFFEQNSTGTGTFTPCIMGSIRIVSGESITQDFSESKPVILIQNKGRSNIGDITANTVTPCVGFPSLFGELPQIASLFRKFYIVDGTDDGGIIVDPVTYTVSDWSATTGTAPWDGSPADYMRLICAYRGRLVLARGSTNPTMWYMTRVGAPTDFNYNSSPLSTAAYAGSIGDAGQPGDTITALIPFSDDYLFFGCASSIAMLEGDPGYQGSVQTITTKTGILGPRAWCVDHKGNFFFMGMGGLYTMPRGARDFVNVSGRRLVNFLDRINLSTTLVHMAFDAFRRYVHVWFTATNGVDNNNHCVYDPETDAFWIDQHPLEFGPWAACDSTGGSYVDMGWLIGGNDGYVRRPYDLSFDDDTQDIDSWVEIGPFFMDSGDITSVVTEIQAEIGSGSGNITWYWFTGDSAELVAAQDFGEEVASGTFSADRNTPVRIRKRGGAHKIRLRNVSNDENWSVEQIRGWFMPGGRRR